MDNNIIKEVIEEMRKLNAEGDKYWSNGGYQLTPESEKIYNYYDNLPTVLKNNKDIILEAFKLRSIWVGHEDLERLPKDKDVAKAVITVDWETADIFKDILDRDLVMELAKEGAWIGPYESGSIIGVLSDKDPEVFKDDKYMKEILKCPGASCFFMEASDEVRNDKETVLEMLNNTFLFLDYLWKYIGDDLKLDPEIQSAFAKAEMRDDEEDYFFTMSVCRDYDSMSPIEKEFSRKVLATEGFLDGVLDHLYYPESDKENILELLDKMSVEENVNETNHGMAR